MHRITGGLALAAGLLAPAFPAAAAEAGAGEGRTDVEERLKEVLKELEAQRKEIDSLKEQLAAARGDSSALGEEVRRYLESDEGRKLLGKGKTDFRAFWKEGLNFETADKAFSLKVQGRVMFDLVFPDPDDDVEATAGDIDATAGFRRLRVEMGGTVHGNIYYQNTIDFAESTYSFADNYVGYRGIPALGSFQIGYFKEPVALEEMTSSKYITFMERSMATNAFAPSRNTGAMAFNSHLDDRLNWQLGVFTDATANGRGQIQHNFTGRLVGTPFVDAEGSALLHVGASFQMRSPEAETDRFRARPEIPFVPRTVDTGTFSVESEDILGLEGAFVRGPLSAQAEWYRAYVEDHPDAPGGSPTYSGWYAFLSWFPTGESRPYKQGAFGRVKPKSEFDGKGGTGAIELALRYDVVDLDDDGVDGGVSDAWTLGINWYLNPNTRVMVNAVTADVHGLGNVNTIAVRFQIDF